MEVKILMGPQGAGKTTWIMRFLKDSTDGVWQVIASDHYWKRDFRTGRRYWIDDCGNQRCWGTEPIPDHIMARAWRQAQHRFLEALEQKRWIIFEGTFPKPRDRKRIIDIAEYYGYKIDCICLYPTLAQCAVRNDERDDRVPDVILARTYGAIQLPTANEGFRNVEIIGAQ